MTNLRQALLLTAVCGAFAMSAGAAHADPLGGKEPWAFQQQNRAGIAATMKAVEDGGNGSGGSGGGTTIVCGGTSGGSGDGTTGTGQQHLRHRQWFDRHRDRRRSGFRRQSIVGS
jgi:hypothetical protein